MSQIQLSTVRYCIKKNGNAFTIIGHRSETPRTVAAVQRRIRTGTIRALGLGLGEGGESLDEPFRNPTCALESGGYVLTVRSYKLHKYKSQVSAKVGAVAF